MWEKNLGAVLGAICMASAVSAVAQSIYPDRPVTLVVPYAPGGPTDIVARAVSQKLSEALHQPVVIDNRPGANEAIAADHVAKARPDGYTVLFATDAALTLNPQLFAKLAYNPATDLVPITRVADCHMVMVVPLSLGVKTLAQFVTWARTQPQPVPYASAGIGNSTHLSMEWFAKQADIKVNHLPYKGIAAALPDLIAQRVDAMFSAVAGVAPYIDKGQLLPLAVSGSARSSVLPNVPTFKEAGYPNFEAAFYLGLMAPKGTPPEAVNRLAVEVSRIVRNPEFRQRAEIAWGLQTVGDSPAEFAEFLRRDQVSAADRVKISGARLD